MLSLSVAELVSLVLALGGFGVEANPNAPTAAEVMKYAPETFDYMLYIDVEAVLPRNYKAFVALANDARLQGSRAGKGISQAVAAAEAARQQLKGRGFDPIEDVKSLAVWVEVKGQGDPNV